MFALKLDFNIYQSSCCYYFLNWLIKSSFEVQFTQLPLHSMFQLQCLCILNAMKIMQTFIVQNIIFFTLWLQQRSCLLNTHIYTYWNKYHIHKNDCCSRLHDEFSMQSPMHFNIGLFCLLGDKHCDPPPPTPTHIITINKTYLILIWT